MLLGKRPDSDQPYGPDFYPGFSGSSDGSGGDPGGDSVRNDHNFSVIYLVFIKFNDFISLGSDFVIQMADTDILAFSVDNRVTAFIMRESCDMEAVTFAGFDHEGNHVFVGLER